MTNGLPPLRGSRRLRSLTPWPLAGSLGLAVVAIGAVLALAGPSEEQPARPEVTSAATVAPSGGSDAPDVRAVDDEADEDEADSLPLVAFELVLPRDPFEPVRPEPVEDEDSDGDGTADGEDGADGDAGDGADQPGDGGGTPPPPSEPGPTLSVQEVFTTSAGELRARISLDDTSYTVAEGDVFEAGYTVTEIAGECVTVDAPGGSVTACVGDPVDTPSQPVQGCHGVEQLVCEGQVVTLVEITTSAGEPAAVIQVGEDRYIVTVGERFASRYELLEIGDGQVRLAFGDEVYTLVAGGGILK